METPGHAVGPPVDDILSKEWSSQNVDGPDAHVYRSTLTSLSVRRHNNNNQLESMNQSIDRWDEEQHA